MNEFEKAREDYEQIPIPAELEERVQAGIRQVGHPFRCSSLPSPASAAASMPR